MNIPIIIGKNKCDGDFFYDCGFKNILINITGENEVIINMKMCGLCGTDIEKINGNYKASGITLGHEPVGIIHKKGKNVKGFKIGERVFVHHHVPCYKCHHCLNDSETMCNQYRKTNIEPGGFSEFFKVPQIVHLITFL